MKNQYRKQACPGAYKWAFALLLGLVVAITAGCEPDDSDGDIIAALLLPTDTLLNLHCEEVGIFTESCVLDDPENPYARTLISEFNDETGEEGNKFEIAETLDDPGQPCAATGCAKAKFYFWATALARRSNGSNQFNTAVQLHTLYGLTGDPVVQAHAIKAYRSILDNYFDTGLYINTCNFEGNPFPCPPNPENIFPVLLRNLAGAALYDGSPHLFPSPFPFPRAQYNAQEAMGEWGYALEDIRNDAGDVIAYVVTKLSGD